MEIRALLNQLRRVFADPNAALEEFTVEPRVSALRLLLLKHAALLITLPLLSLAAPLRWIFGPPFSPGRDIVAPLILVGGFLALAMVFDKILERSRGPELFAENEPPRNLALYLHLPVSAVGVFFLFHFLLGFAMILVSGLYCAGISIIHASRFRRLSPARTITHYLSAGLFLLLPVVFLLFFLNLMRTYSLFRYLYW